MPARRWLRRLLAGAGWRVLEADTGRRALTLARRHRPELAVVDWCLAGELDGLTVTRRLQRAGAAAPVIVMVSGVRDHVDDEDLALAAGAASFFGKLEVAGAGRAFLRHIDELAKSRTGA